MQLDMPTLMLAGSFVAAVSSLFLIFAWMQTERAGGVLWWAAANLLLAVSIPLIAGRSLVPGAPSLVFGITLLNLSPALIWAAARSVNRHRVDISMVVGGAVLWFAAYAVPAIAASPDAQVTLNFAIAAIYLYAAAYEFWKGRADQLTARAPLVVLLFLHATFSAVAMLHGVSGGLAPNGTVLLNGWLGFVHFETLAFIVGTSIFTVAMARERNEVMHRVAAATDDLTKLASRRMLYETGEAMLARSLQDDTSLAVILFDVDGFKGINDSFGHGPGDEILRIFGVAALKTLRASDVIGRLGGDEFAAVLPGASVGAAYVAAERIRSTFTTMTRRIGSGEIGATLSVGIAQAHPSSTFDSIITSADQALYRAKVDGRDRIEVAEYDEANAFPAPAPAPVPAQALARAPLSPMPGSPPMPVTRRVA
jgi:diguanylate cyclase (GGDEF)-like protein